MKTLLASLVMIAGASSALANASLPEGSWQTNSGSMHFYPEHNYNDPLMASGCGIDLEIKQEPGVLVVKKLTAACSCPAFIFDDALTDLSFSYDAEGWLFNEQGLAGRVTDQSLEFDLLEGEYATHYVRLGMVGDGMQLEWTYEDPVEPSYRIVSGATPLKKQ